MTNYTLKVWGSSDSNVFAVENGTMKLWVYNGVSWSADPRISAQLGSIGGSGPGDVWAGGMQSVWHLDATSTWKQTTIAGSAGLITNVSSVSATNAWAVDSIGNVFRTTDGTTWKQMDTGVTNGGNANLKTFSVNPTMTWLSGTGGILSIRK